LSIYAVIKGFYPAALIALIQLQGSISDDIDETLKYGSLPETEIVKSTVPSESVVPALLSVQTGGVNTQRHQAVSSVIFVAYWY
jgi:hypothetical protein